MKILNYNTNTTVTPVTNYYYNDNTTAFDAEVRRILIIPLSGIEFEIEPKGKYSVFEIANFFLSKESMTHEKLQKLCYYAQAWCYALKGFRLEDTDYQAWIQGPISQVMWERFKSFGNSTIKIRGNYRLASISPEDEKLLEDVWDTYGDLTGNALTVLSQRELPWQEARKEYDTGEQCSIVISPASMTSYYKSIYSTQ